MMPPSGASILETSFVYFCLPVARLIHFRACQQKRAGCRRSLCGLGLEGLNECRRKRSHLKTIALPDSGQWFSDLNPWMLKDKQALEIPVERLVAPRRKYRNVSRLAEIASASSPARWRAAPRAV